jgi:hypothetical protein
MIGWCLVDDLKPDMQFSCQDIDELERNPCVLVWGMDPEGRRCKACLYLAVKVRSKRYYKCRKRTITAGPATDHRVGWNACSLFSPFKVCGACRGNGWILEGSGVGNRAIKCRACDGWGRVEDVGD